MAVVATGQEEIPLQEKRFGLLILALTIALTPLSTVTAQAQNGEGEAEALLPSEPRVMHDLTDFDIPADTAQSSPTTIFSDGDFSAGWVDRSWVLPDTRYPGQGPGTSTSAGGTRVATGGNLGAYRATTHTVVRGDVIVSGSLYNGAVMTPSVQGAITALRFQADTRLRGCCSSSFYVLLEQDGVVFRSVDMWFRSSSAWKPASGLFVREDFSVLGRSADAAAPADRLLPIFDTTGGPIRFGYAFAQVIAIDSFGDRATGTIDLDNWKVTVNPPVRGVLNGLEVTQAVQNLYNSYDLVGDRLTFVRAYLSNPTAIDQPDVRLHGIDSSGNPLPGSPLTPSYPYGKVPVSAQRVILSSTANFVLPLSWAYPGSTIQLWVTLNGEVPSLCRLPQMSEDANCSVRVAFEQAHHLQVALQPLSWMLLENGIAGPNPIFGDAPDQASIRQAQEAIYQLLPVSSLQITRLPEERLILDDVDTCPLSILDPDFKVACQLLSYQAHNQALGVQAAMLPEPYVGLALLDRRGQQIVGGKADGRAATSVVSGSTPAHEVGHTFSLLHTSCGGASAADPNFPNPAGRISSALSGPEAQYGIRINALTEPGALLMPGSADLMGYCPPPEGISGYHWDKASRFLTQTGFVAFGFDPAESVAAAWEGSMVVSGVVTPSTGSAQISGVVRTLAASSWPQPTDASRYYLRVRYSDLSHTDEYALDLSEAEYPGWPAYRFTLRVPYRPTITRLSITDPDTELAFVTPSANPPTVTVSAPVAGSTLTGPTPVSWTGSDPDGDVLTYVVWYSTNGTDWQYVAGPTPATTISVDPAQLPGTGQGVFRVEVSDGFRIAYGLSGPVAVTNKPPTMEVVFPEPDMTFALTDRITLAGRGRDLEDGWLADRAMRWLFGSTAVATTGSAVIDASVLGVGTHTLVLEGRDRASATGAASVVVSVVPGPRVPAVELQVGIIELPVVVEVGGSTEVELGVYNPGPGELGYQVTPQAAWVRAPASPLTTASPLVLTVSGVGLSVGEYTTSINIRADIPAVTGASQTVQVRLTVTEARVYLPLIRRRR
jgi:hypothetical protein